MPANDYAYFLDYDEETDSLNVFAAVTNRGLYGDNQSKWTGEADEPFRDPRAKHIRGGTELEGLGATFFRDDSDTSWTGATDEHLGPRIPEGVARKLHPRLFERIDAEETHSQTG